MITAENITDAQIRELLASVNTTDMHAGHTIATWCRSALGEIHLHGGTQHGARTRCAEILNARAAKEQP